MILILIDRCATDGPFFHCLGMAERSERGDNFTSDQYLVLVIIWFRSFFGSDYHDQLHTEKHADVEMIDDGNGELIKI